MRKGVLCAAVAVLVCCCLAPAASAARPVVGIGDQKPELFSDQRFSWLGLRHARLVIPWYVEPGGSMDERAYVERWMSAARRARVQPLVGFGHGFVGWTRIYLPSVSEYRRSFRAFRRRYPWAKTFIVWNEANHCSQPTCRRPARAAAYFDAARRVCPSCRLVAADVIDQPNMGRWLRRFRRAARSRPRLWGLHNYLDVNRLRSTGTRRMLRLVKGPVWITETGGVVYRKHTRGKADFPENARHAGRVTTYLLKLANRHRRRLRRVYVYHWNADRVRPAWDSGLIDAFGRPRSGFSALARHLGRDPRRIPAAPPAAPEPTPEPAAPPPPAGENPPPPEGGGSAPPPEDPPEEECSLLELCPPPLSPW